MVLEKRKGGIRMKEKLLVFLNELEKKYDTGAEYCEDVSDASDGNYDDAYALGVEFGEESGALMVINEIRKFIEEESE
jgi:hypothetical protein